MRGISSVLMICLEVVEARGGTGAVRVICLEAVEAWLRLWERRQDIRGHKPCYGVFICLTRGLEVGGQQIFFEDLGKSESRAISHFGR